MRMIVLVCCCLALALSAQAPKPVCTPQSNFHMTYWQGQGQLNGHWWISATCKEKSIFLFGYIGAGGRVPIWPPITDLDRFYKDPKNMNTTIGAAINSLWPSGPIGFRE